MAARMRPVLRPLCRGISISGRTEFLGKAGSLVVVGWFNCGFDQMGESAGWLNRPQVLRFSLKF